MLSGGDTTYMIGLIDLIGFGSNGFVVDEDIKILKGI